MKAIWNDQVIADSDATVFVEGNHYFPMAAVRESFLKSSDRTSFCPWKGTASYFNLSVNGGENEDAAWYYANPKGAAKQLAGHIAFWRGVEIVET